MSTELKAEDGPENDPELWAQAAAEVLAEKLQKATAALPKSGQPLSGSMKPYKSWAPRMRIAAGLCCAIAVFAAALASLSSRFTVAAIIAVIAVLGGIWLGISLLTEVLTGAGYDIETQFKSDAGFYRRYNFKPSIPSAVHLFGFLGLTVSSIVLGYSELYLNLWLSHETLFSKALDVVSAIYFSLVTFATVGYGDISPNSNLCRFIVSTEIAVSLFVIPIVIAISISWILTRTQEATSRRADERAESTQLREQAFKDAGLGVYQTGDNTTAKIRERVATLRREKEVKT